MGVILEEDFQIQLNTKTKPPVAEQKKDLVVNEKPPEKTIETVKPIDKRLASNSLTSIPFFAPLASSSIKSSKFIKIHRTRPSFLDDDYFLNENFDLNFENVSQSPHLFLIGSCIDVALNSCSSSTTTTSTSASSSTNKHPQSSEINQTKAEYLNSNTTNLDAENLNNNYDSLCFFKQIDHLNVDGFEWDLI
jgi:hypothetical protein